MIRLLLFSTLLILYSCNGTIKKKAKNDTISSEVSTVVGSNNEQKDTLTWENNFPGIHQVEGYFPEFLPNSDQFIYTDKNYRGLWTSSVHSRDSKKITDFRGAGFRPLTFEDQIIFQRKEKKTSFVLLNLGTEEEQNFTSRSEAIHAAFKNHEDYRYVDLATDLNSLIIYESGQKTKEIRPGNFSNYLNPSFSPNGQQILFEVSGRGGFICGLDAEITHELGPLDEPTWINNEEVVYARSEDDGMETIRGDIYVRAINSNKEVLISKGIASSVQHPTVHHSGRRILVNTENGRFISIYKAKI